MTQSSNISNPVSPSASNLASDVKRAADDVAGRARGTAEQRLEGGKDRVGHGLAHLADALRKTASSLADGADGEDAGLVDPVARAADRVSAASDYFRRRSLGQVIGDVVRFARREPAVFLGGAFAAGLFVGRFLRSTSQRSRPPSGFETGEGGEGNEELAQTLGGS
jgi:hypothetical protein